MTWFATDRPSRAVNIGAPPGQVAAACDRQGAAVSAIEELPTGGTRVVLVTLDAADAIRHAFKGKLLPGNAARTPLRRRGD